MFKKWCFKLSEELTLREQEILTILKQEPMLSQDDLSKRLGISRSAAAVHISKLVKKGYIIGRGYVFNERVGIAVMGAGLEEIHGDYNMEQIYSEQGGPMIQVAENLTNLGVPVTILSILGRDSAGEQIFSRLNSARVNTNHIVWSTENNTAKMTRLVAEHHCSSVKDYTILEELDINLLYKNKRMLTNCEYLVLDNSLPYITLINAVQTAVQKEVQVVLHITNQYSTYPLHELLPNIALLVCGNKELTSISGDINLNLKSMRNMVKDFLDAGLQAAVITIDGEGVLIEGGEERSMLPLPPNIDTEMDKARTKIISGILYALLRNQSYRQGVRLGLGLR
ncbi:MAG: winged helix-turn-helix transcriptional regulator [Firmicutes bacterium]|nr:winged helix-turn-helix transcriptional regulator [Bacillota bacterium]